MCTRAPTVLTIGHSNHPFDAFAGLLRRAGIEAVIDVRSVPHSRRFPQYSKAALRQALAAGGVGYLFLGGELGARRDEDAAYVEGRADYDAIAALPAFGRGIERVVAEAAARRVALMCAERDPLDCHRAVLVSRHLVAGGTQVEHLLADGGRQSHAATERRMIAAAGTDAPDLFAGDDGLPVEPLARAYALTGREMAYRRGRR